MVGFPASPDAWGTVHKSLLYYVYFSTSQTQNSSLELEIQRVKPGFGSLVLTYGWFRASPDAWGTVHNGLLDQHRLTLLSSQTHSLANTIGVPNTFNTSIHTGHQYLQPQIHSTQIHRTPILTHTVVTNMLDKRFPI